MKLTKKLKIEEVKRDFNKQYPHLKIEFYADAHKVGEGSAITDQIPSFTALNVLNPNMEEGEITYPPTMKVKELEELYEEEFGLHVQVFRKSGELWLQTSATDDWTLETQEGKGARSEKFT